MRKEPMKILLCTLEEIKMYEWMSKFYIFYIYRLHRLLKCNVFTMTDATKNLIIYDIIWAPHGSHVAVY